MQFDFWAQAVDLRFLVTFALVVGAFLPLGYSFWRTWQAEVDQEALDNE